MSYNLNENVAEYFEFEVNGHAYQMRYPTTEEVLEVQKLEKDEKKQTEWLYTFITPVKADSPDIKEVMAKVNVKVLQNFSEMIKTEFSS